MQYNMVRACGRWSGRYPSLPIRPRESRVGSNNPEIAFLR